MQHSNNGKLLKSQYKGIILIFENINSVGSSFARQHDSPIVNNSQKKSQQRRQLDFRDNDG